MQKFKTNKMSKFDVLIIDVTAPIWDSLYRIVREQFGSTIYSTVHTEESIVDIAIEICNH